MYRVPAVKHIQTEASRVQDLILVNRYPPIAAWTAESIQEVMRVAGVIYTPAEISAIIQELILRGVLEQVP